MELCPSNSNNNELSFINLAKVPADVILLSRLRKAVPLSASFGDNTNLKPSGFNKQTNKK
ncbi:MAG: hypothetical protein M3Z26_15655 [Bacteroidota bacterium]|nr:hypothetical protein [Bacteroidota bacterium]